MADGREDKRATFQFIKEFEVQNCPDPWDISSAAYKDTRSMGQISTDIQFRPNFSIIQALSVSSPAINIQQDQDKRQLFVSATAQFSVCCDMA